MRKLFFGVEIPAPIKSRLLKVRAEVPGARWQTFAQMHLTLLFLGNVEDERVLAVREAACRISLTAFELQVAGLGCFGRPCAPRILWAGVQPAAPVASLHSALKSEMAQLGFTPESRAFRPHITLSRFKHRPGSIESLLAEYEGAAFGAFRVERFVLFESVQRAGGSVYPVIARFAGKIP
ncbi:RNA 2',3'-cyclic phosphodiesterase [Marinobacter sp. X15-166B]|uniref:RNA 2',3'-cyclic phosphodiesterase n=1 Tax=Marinobacter sp. X15-166B TaxID=1897620 RepID=UPI00085C8651|nr:RNA 2',3'-cyclic phosphodiesterase [Marinobacter sp. X15-166B]OEY65977.1 2'-5' RNA ligase [Marinobacter sp. X15-166B]